jgi:hypothetical protein
MILILCSRYATMADQCFPSIWPYHHPSRLILGSSGDLDAHRILPQRLRAGKVDAVLTLVCLALIWIELEFHDVEMVYRSYLKGPGLGCYSHQCLVLGISYSLFHTSRVCPDLRPTGPDLFESTGTAGSRSSGFG